MPAWLLPAGIIGAIAVLLVFFTLRIRRGAEIPLRPLASYTLVKGQIGRAIESGSTLHVTLGQASIASAHSPATLAGLVILDNVVQESCANGVPPLVTVGEASLLLVAQDSFRHAFEKAERSSDFKTGLAQFVAHENDTLAYGSGVGYIVGNNKLVSNIMVGHFGSEVAFMGIAGERQELDQVIGTDDPTGLAVGYTLTNQVLVGEEFLAAPAYLEGQPSQVASLLVQDIARWVIFVALLAGAIYQWVGK